MQSPNVAKLDSTAHNPQSGQEVAKQNLLRHSPKPSRSLPRSHADYWKSRLFRPSYTRNGDVCEVNDLAVRIQHGGQREVFTLATTNKDAASIKARDIWTTIKGAGWEVARARFKPDQVSAPKVDLTVGDLLQEVEESTDLRPRTFLNYANCLRTIAAEVFGIHPPKGKSKFDYRSGGNQEWRKRVDGIKLARLTAHLIGTWQRERVSAAGKSEVMRASARRTCNSYVRCARSLFAPAIIKKLKNVRLPDPLPFTGVELLETGSMKYISRINAHTLIAGAKSTLKVSDPEAYKVFLLALFAGLRKAEIDLLEWRMVDLAANVIRLENTEWLHLKTHDSAGEITIDPEVGVELRSFKQSSNSAFVVGSTVTWNNGSKELSRTRKPRNDSTRGYYRCEPVFERLNEWLRAHGVAANKPLHELRKEVGAIVATNQGIYAASRYLRHSDITTTARHYADQKERINVGLGKLLNTAINAGPQPVLAAA